MASTFEGYASASDPWMITQSSGTTGTPKLIAESETMICQRAINSVDPALPATPVYVCLFPPLSPPALVHGLGVLSIGGTLVFAQVTELLGRASVDCVLGAPNQFLSLLEAVPPSGDRRIPLARIAGAPASKTFLSRLLRYFSGVTYTYASTEASVVVANLITSVENLPENVSLGRPIPNVELCIVGEDGAVLPPGREGIVKLRAPWQVNEYVGDPALSATVFRDGWFYPGDLGYVSESGELTITGRVNEQLNIGGEKLNPTVIDTAILAAPGIKDAACFARRNAQGVDQLEAVIAVSGPMELPAILATLARQLAARFERPHIPRKIYVMSELPRLPNGKIARQSLPDATRGSAFHDLFPQG
jgi:acyl-CoA synthetase (AMP-forming)/AMP-acid ligase II